MLINVGEWCDGGLHPIHLASVHRFRCFSRNLSHVTRSEFEFQRDDRVYSLRSVWFMDWGLLSLPMSDRSTHGGQHTNELLFYWCFFDVFITATSILEVIYCPHSTFRALSIIDWLSITQCHNKMCLVSSSSLPSAPDSLSSYNNSSSSYRYRWHPVLLQSARVRFQRLHVPDSAISSRWRLLQWEAPIGRWGDAALFASSAWLH